MNRGRDDCHPIQLLSSIYFYNWPFVVSFFFSGKISTVTDATCSDMDIDIEDNGDGTFSIYYTVKDAGEYTISIKFGGQPIPDGLYTVTVSQQTCCNVSHLRAWCSDWSNTYLFPHAVPPQVADASAHPLRPNRKFRVKSIAAFISTSAPLLFPNMKAACQPSKMFFLLRPPSVSYFGPGGSFQSRRLQINGHPTKKSLVTCAQWTRAEGK